MLQILLPLLKRIKGGPKTTILGALIIVYSGFLLYKHTETLSMVLDGGFMSVGIVLFLLDKLKKEKDENEVG
jgi:hypothetical protein